jgi:hypothetical protein
VGFEPTVPAFERAKTIHALDRAASVIVTDTYCDMMSESWNSPLLDNGSLTHLWIYRFVETDLVRNALSMSTDSTNNFHEHAKATNIFHGYKQATNIFHGHALDYTKSRPEKNDSFVREARRQFNS